jgi:hypothetical protein
LRTISSIVCFHASSPLTSQAAGCRASNNRSLIAHFVSLSDFGPLKVQNKPAAPKFGLFPERKDQNAGRRNTARFEGPTALRLLIIREVSR